MPKSLTFLHTAAPLAPSFDELASEIAPDVPVRHLIAGDLLDMARAEGPDATATRSQVRDAVLHAVAAGARVVLCTCSTIGDPAERAAADADAVVMRVDRPMAERAVAAGSRILVVATLESTLGPTTDLIRDAAAKAGRDVTVSTLLADAAWAKFEAGDADGYYAEIASAVKAGAGDADAIVLAQGSMAPAADLCGGVTAPVLSSPRLGVEAAVAAFRASG
ncbi:arylsulfatase [Candidatus Poribacteria bacterium]|nr:arylsulfatase [Candidatus Poribacteria bacterium]